MIERTAPAVRLERTIAAPPERVYRAWLDPNVMTRWFAPATFHCTAAQVDERVGGRFSIQHRDDAGVDRGGAEAEIVDLAPNERLVLRWNFVGPDRVADPELATLLTVTFAPVDGGTRLTLTHEQLDGLQRRAPEIAGGINPGWATAFDRLDDALKGTDR